MPVAPKSETPEQREARLKRQKAYEARRRARDPDGWREAQNASARRYREANPDKAKAATKRWRSENKDRFNELRRIWRSNNVIRALVNEARSRAKARGVEFSIAADDVPPMGTHCPLLGEPFSTREERRSRNSPSLDRIDPSKGYVKGNVWVVGYRANLIKNDGTADEHEKIARAMRNHQDTSDG
jgi:hypothetical protein